MANAGQKRALDLARLFEFEICVCQIIMCLFQGFFGSFPLGDVFLDGDEIGYDSIIVFYRGDEGLLPIAIAVLLLVVELAPPFAAGSDRFP